MKQDIYDLLNDMEIDLTELKRENFTELETKRIMKKFRKSTIPNRSYKKYAGVIAAAIMSVGILGTIPSFAMTNPVAHSIVNFLGIEKDLDSYTTVINKAITKGNVTIQLNEVILDGEELIVSTTVKSTECIEGKHIYARASVYVNGREVNGARGGGSREIDDYTVEEVMHYQLGENYTGKLDVALVFNNVKVGNDRQKGTWKFEFSTNGEALSARTKSQKMSQTFMLPDETQITFIRYAANDMGEKIYFNLSQPNMSYDIELRGKDNLGNPIVFTFTNQKGTEGVLKLNDYFSSKHEGAKSYTLALYTVKFPEESGRLSNDFKKIGEEFDILFK